MDWHPGVIFSFFSGKSGREVLEKVPRRASPGGIALLSAGEGRGSHAQF